LNWIPEVVITSDRGHVVVAGRNVSANVFAAIKEKEGNPLLEHPDKVVGKILIGEDYARESVAIWPAFDEDVDKLTIFVAGLSGETAVIEDPANPEKEIVLRKNYMIEYEVPGTEEHPQKQSVKMIGSKWVMR